ncbi:MAG: hypothetical protein H6Q19_489 [Bacteroidetes bacterium]|nr:hypothetical protein [Bacteroidota bacterium]
MLNRLANLSTFVPYVILCVKVLASKCYGIIFVIFIL